MVNVYKYKFNIYDNAILTKIFTQYNNSNYIIYCDVLKGLYYDKKSIQKDEYCILNINYNNNNHNIINNRISEIKKYIFNKCRLQDMNNEDDYDTYNLPKIMFILDYDKTNNKELLYLNGDDNDFVYKTFKLFAGENKDHIELYGNICFKTNEETGQNFDRFFRNIFPMNLAWVYSLKIVDFITI
jgi:hypothetical protein